MADFIVHGIPGSPYVRAALLGLEEKGASWRLAAMGPAETKGPAHMARNPFGRIPALEHGDFILYETQAILRYLDRLFPNPPLIPADPKAEARMNQICGVTDWYVMPDISSGIVFGRLVAPKFGIPADESRIADAMPRARVCMAELARLLADQTYMAGDAVTLADLMLAPQLQMLSEVAEGGPMFAAHPTLKAWLDRLCARPSMQRTTWDRLLADAQAAKRP